MEIKELSYKFSDNTLEEIFICFDLFKIRFIMLTDSTHKVCLQVGTPAGLEYKWRVYHGQQFISFAGQFDQTGLVNLGIYATNQKFDF